MLRPRCIPVLFRGVLWLLPLSLPGQVLMSARAPEGVVRPYPSDLAIFEAGDVRQDLPCHVQLAKPVLGFDLRFHAVYDVGVPLRELSGEENRLTIVFRVRPADSSAEPSYFVQHVKVPTIQEDAKGDADLQGMFDTGEGNYHVDWLMRDRADRVCSESFDIEANLPPKDREMKLALSPQTVQPAEAEPFKEEPPVARAASDQPLNVKVLINFAPQEAGASALQPLDTSALVSILRTISREPHIAKFSVVAFNLQEQRVVYRQENSDRIDFPALGAAVQGVKFGTVDLKHLAQKNSETDFLGDLVCHEITPADHPDALVFAGPKAFLDATVPPAKLREVGTIDYPVFYMNYNLQPQTKPWRDSIGHVVRYLKGQEFTISRPRDLWAAMGEVVSRTAKARHTHHVSASAAAE